MAPIETCHQLSPTTCYTKADDHRSASMILRLTLIPLSDPHDPTIFTDR